MNVDLNSFVMSANLSIREALNAIERNKNGIIFLTRDDGVLSGSVTDGDIRRALLSGATLEDCVINIANDQFIFASSGDSREEVLKKLDSRVKVLPILEGKRLVNIVTRDYFPARPESDICVRSRAPVRVSFGGGGSDVTHFFENKKGAVLNAAVSLYAHSVLRTRSDDRIIITSGDLQSSFSAENLDCAINQKGPFSLFQAILSVVRPEYGFELEVYSDFGIGSGLGGSASVAVGVLACFNALRDDRWSKYEIAEIAYQAERVFMGVSGGWQDQYAAAFGGINYIEFSAKKNIVTPLAIEGEIVDELQQSLILCNTGILHESGDIHLDQKSHMMKQDIQWLVEENVKITEALKEALIFGDLYTLGVLMDEGWRIKKQLSSLISNPEIDQKYDEVIKSGAVGGKLLGAGGGGYFLFFVKPFDQVRVRTRLKEIGLVCESFQFDRNGVVSWKIRDRTNSRGDNE